MIEVVCVFLIAAGGFYTGVIATVYRYNVKMQAFKKEIAAIQSDLKENKS